MLRVLDQSNLDGADRRNTQMTNTSFTRIGTEILRDSEVNAAHQENNSAKGIL